MRTSQIPVKTGEETTEYVIGTIAGEDGERKLRRLALDEVGATGPQGEQGEPGADGGDGSLKYIARVQQFGGGALDVKIIYNTLGELVWTETSPGIISITREDGWPGDGRTINFIGQESSVPGTELFNLTRAGTGEMILSHCVFNPGTPGFEPAATFSEVSVSISVFPAS